MIEEAFKEGPDAYDNWKRYQEHLKTLKSSPTKKHIDRLNSYYADHHAKSFAALDKKISDNHNKSIDMKAGYAAKIAAYHRDEPTPPSSKNKPNLIKRIISHLKSSNK